MRVLVMTLLGLMSLPIAAWAQTARSGGPPLTVFVGDSDAEIWLQTEPVEPPFEVYLSGDGLSLTTPPVLMHNALDGDDAAYDHIAVYFEVAEDASPGIRDIWLEDQNGLRVIRGAFVVTPTSSPIGTYRQAVRVDAVSRASPSYARPGEQVNLWLVGRGFEPTSSVSLIEKVSDQLYSMESPFPARCTYARRSK